MSYEIKPGNTVYALCTIGDAPSGDSPGGVYASFGTELIVTDIREPTEYEPLRTYSVCHPDLVQTKQRFWVYGREISKMKHFNHNKEISWHDRQYSLHTRHY